MILTVLLVVLLVALTSENLAILVAGFVSPVLTQLTKNTFGVESLRAYGLHIFFSVALAAGVLYVAGDLSIGNLAEKASLIAVMSSTLFQLFKKDSGLVIGPSDKPQE